MVGDPSSCSSVASSLARVSAVFLPEGIHCKTAVSARQIKIVQEPCECGGGHPGLPVPNSRHGLRGHKATLNTGYSFFLFFFAFCSGESPQGRQSKTTLLGVTVLIQYIALPFAFLPLFGSTFLQMLLLVQCIIFILLVCAVVMVVWYEFFVCYLNSVIEMSMSSCYSFCYWLYLYQIWHQEIRGVQNHAFWFVFEWGQ